MEKFELQPLRDLPIEEVAARLGLDVRQHKALCPFHNDHHPSLSFNTRRNTYRCFVCDAHGGTIDLVMHLLHKTFPEACQWLSGGTYQPLSYPAPQSLSHSATQSLDKPFDASRYSRFFDHPYLSTAARHFLFDQRRLDPRVVRWCRLTSWRDRQGTHWLQIPYYSRDGKLVGVQNRNLNYHKEAPAPDAEGHLSPSTLPDAEGHLSPFTSHLSPSPAPRFKFPRGSHCSIYNLPVLNLLHEGEPLYIAEGPSDCWALLSSGHKAIAIPSATLLTKKDIEQLSIINSQLSISYHMFPDQDLPGERLFLQLKKLLPNLTRHQLPPTCKDYSDYYLQMKPPPMHLSCTPSHSSALPCTPQNQQ